MRAECSRLSGQTWRLVLSKLKLKMLVWGFLPCQNVWTLRTGSCEQNLFRTQTGFHGLTSNPTNNLRTERHRVVFLESLVQPNLRFKPLILILVGHSTTGRSSTGLCRLLNGVRTAHRAVRRRNQRAGCLFPQTFRRRDVSACDHSIPTGYHGNQSEQSQVFPVVRINHPGISSEESPLWSLNSQDLHHGSTWFWSSIRTSLLTVKRDRTFISAQLFMRL